MPPRCTLRASSALPACEHPEPRPDGAVLCLQAGALSVLDGPALAPRWTTTRAYTSAMWIERGRSIVATRGDGIAVIVDADDGHERATLDLALYAHAFGHAPAGDLALLVEPVYVSIIDGGRGTVRRVSPCPGTKPHMVGSVSSADDVVIACRHGVVAVLTREGDVRRVLQTRLEDDADLAAGALAPNGRLVVASMTGQVQTLDLDTGAVIAERRTGVGVIRTIAFSPDGELVAVLGDRGGVSVWTASTWALRRRLPAEHERWVAWSENGGQMVTAGRTVGRWSIDRARRAASIAAPRPPGGCGAIRILVYSVSFPRKLLTAEPKYTGATLPSR